MARIQRRRFRDLGRGGAPPSRIPGPVPTRRLALTVTGRGGRLDSVLARLDPELSRSTVTRMVRAGLVAVNGQPARRPARPVGPGDHIDYQPPAPERLEPSPETIPLTILYDDSDLVVIDKPAGMVTHPSRGHASGTLVHALLGMGGTWSALGGSIRPGIVHRLDRGTSGLILAARTDVAHRDLASQLADCSLARTYLAVARGSVSPGDQVVDGPIGRHPRDRLRMAIVPDGRAARTRVRALERRGGHTLVQCDLETGRTHQVRVHLAALGHPIAGDDLYGRRRPGDPERPLLHAFRLRFRHPTSGEPMTFESPPPADFVTFWDSLL